MRRRSSASATIGSASTGRNLVQFCAMPAGSGIESPPGVGARAGEGEGPESLFVKLLAGRLGTELHPTLAPELGGAARGTKDRRPKGRSMAPGEQDGPSEAPESRLGFS